MPLEGRCQPLPALQHQVPVDWRQQIFLEQPGQVRWLSAVDEPGRKGRLQHTAVTELREQDFALFDRQRAAAIAVISCLRLYAVENGERVGGCDGSLLPNCS